MRRLTALLIVVLFFSASCQKQEKAELERLQQEADRLQQEMAGTGAPESGVFVSENAEFFIDFDKDRYGIDAGSTVSVHYTLPQAATLEVITKEGWSAVVNATGDKEGIIVINAPDPATSSDIVVKAITANGAGLAVNLPIMVRDPYTDATRTDVAAMGYFCFNTELATDYNFKMMAEAGFNMLSVEYVDNWKEQLDLAHKYGLKVVLFINVPAGEYYESGGTSPTLKETIDYAKNHPALAAYQIIDEPSVKWLDYVYYQRKAVREMDPDHPVYINLGPSNASSWTYGVETFEEYAETYVRDCEFDILTFDQYPVYTYGIDPSWFRSLAVYFRLCKQYNIPLWAFTLSCREISREDPTLENIRLQCNVNLAYGAQVNQYFVYRNTSGTNYCPLVVDWSTGIASYTEVYDFCKQYNHEMHNRGFVFADCNVTKICNPGVFDAWVDVFNPKDLPPQIKNLSAEEETLISFIENRGNEYVVVVNKLWKKPQKVGLELNDMVYMIDCEGQFTEYQPGVYPDIQIDPGDMLVIKVK